MPAQDCVELLYSQCDALDDLKVNKDDLVVNIVNYGAIGDGVTNDKPAWDLAVAKLLSQGGGMLYLPAKTYNLGSVSLGSNITLFAQGAVIIGGLNSSGCSNVNILPGLTINADGFNGISFNSLGTGDNISIDGVIINKSTATNYSSDGIMFYKCGTNLSVRNCVINGASRIGITFDNCTGSSYLVENNTISNARNAIHVESTDNVDVINNKITDCGNSTLGSSSHPYAHSLNFAKCNNVVFKGNRFYGSNGGMWTLNSPCSNITFADNVNMVGLMLENFPTGAAVYTDFSFLNNTGGGVSANGNVTTPGRWIFSNNKAFSNITGLLDFTYLYIDECTINGNLTATSSIANSRVNFTNSFIDFTTNGNIQADHMLVDNVDFVCDYSAGSPDYMGLRVAGTGILTYTNNKSRGAAGNHLYLSSTLAKCCYRNNFLSGNINANGVPLADRTPDQYYMSAAPTTGTWARNTIVWNAAMTAAGYTGWVCVTAGSPGTWKGFGLIQA